MRKLIVILALIAMQGCATLQSKETFALCKAGDVASTMAVLGKGGAEANPLMAAVINNWGYVGLIGVSVALVALVWKLHDQINPAVMTTLNVAQCGIVAHNLGVLNEITKAVK